ncbi:hypothetical protein BELL_0509g00040 [Botrytis elliptica]|uniref:Uncharacterized protein n=1 Tax=Botrytis elliptica TaxID=278938 RepID=A0A4Z1JE30_9HELO|nr:hypothetical protein BELL_0509g00040 [Botrytis elliptica]
MELQRLELRQRRAMIQENAGSECLLVVSINSARYSQYGEMFDAVLPSQKENPIWIGWSSQTVSSDLLKSWGYRVCWNWDNPTALMPLECASI